MSSVIVEVISSKLDALSTGLVTLSEEGGGDVRPAPTLAASPENFP